MTTGTPGFVGSRLREARQLRGRTAVALAEEVGVTPQAISGYEHGKNSPSASTLRVLSDALAMPDFYFTQPPRADRDRTVFYRSLSAATKRSRDSAEVRLEWLQDIVDYVAEFVTLPGPNFPELLTEDPGVLSGDDVEDLATQA